MKSDYWNVDDAQVVAKTGKPLTHWHKVLDRFHARDKKSNDVVAHLQDVHDVPRYWARTLTTNFLKQAASVAKTKAAPKGKVAKTTKTKPTAKATVAAKTKAPAKTAKPTPKLASKPKRKPAPTRAAAIVLPAAPPATPAAPAARAGRPRSVQPVASQPGAVDAFLATLEHPLLADIQAARALVLAADPLVAEAVKWNAPSFRTTEFFATVNLRSRDAVQFVFHLGAKVRDNTRSLLIDDPSGLIQWITKDRCLVTIGAGADIARNGPSLQAIVRQWIRHV